MNQMNFHWPGLPEVPGDLRTWVKEPEFVPLVFGAVQEVLDGEANGRLRLLPAGVPRVLLTTLTYAYGVGILTSDEIELRTRTEIQLRYLSARMFVSAQQLRRFRREHRPWVTLSLGRLMQRTWEARFTGVDAWGDFGGPDLEAFFTKAAEERINSAVLMDSMALDI